MSTNRKGKPAAPAVFVPYGQVPVPQTVRELRGRIRQAPDLKDRVRRDVAEGLRAFMDAVPEAADLRPLGSVLYPLYARLRDPALNLTPARRRNVVALVRRALEWLYSNEKGISARIQPLSEAWAPLWDGVERGTHEKWTLSRFVRWCDRLGIAPADVDERALVGFGEYVSKVGAARFARHYQWVALRAWNLLSVRISTWPRQTLTMPSEGGSTATPRSAFAPAFLADMDRYADACAGKVQEGGVRRQRVSETQDLRRSRKPLAQATIDSRTAALRRAAALLAQSAGRELHEITSLKQLTEPGAGAALIDTYMDEIGEDAPAVRNVAIALVHMAKVMFPTDTDGHARLQMVLTNTTRQSRRMSQRNVDLLLSLTPETMEGLYAFGHQALDEAIRNAKEKGRVTDRDVTLGQVGVAVAILLQAPVRIKNLAAIRIGENLLIDARGTAAAIVFEAVDVKNGKAIDTALSARTAALIRRYIDELLPLIERRPDPQALFPGKHGSRDKADFGELIGRILERRLGRRINPHFFRHLSAFTYLMHHPGDYETVRVMLGHKDEATTRDFYCALEEGPLKKKAQDCLAAVEAEYAEGGSGRRRRRRRREGSRTKE